MKLVCGVGRNDVGMSSDNLVYRKWLAMLRRCYKHYKGNSPTYTGCSVHPDWHLLSNFSEWVNHQGGCVDKVLDKDILVHGNTEYGPSTCLLVSKEVNAAVLKREGARGDYPLGVTKVGDKYKAQMSINGRVTYLGVFSDPFAAHRSWQKNKSSYLRGLAEQEEGKVQSALLTWAEAIEEDINNCRETK